MVDDLKTQLKAAYKQSFPTLRNNNDYTAIVNERQFNRLQGYLTDAKAKGAHVEALNNAADTYLPANSPA